MHELSCDVNVGVLHRLTVRTVSEFVYVGQEERVEVTAIDSQGNTFSTLQGLPFHWQVDLPDRLALTRLSEQNTMEVTPARRHVEESSGAFSDSVLLTGLTPGIVTVSAKASDAAYDSLPAAVTRITVKEHLRVVPREQDGPTCVVPGTAGRLGLQRVQATRTNVTLPSVNFRWSTPDTQVGQVHPTLGAFRIHPNSAGSRVVVSVSDRRLPEEEGASTALLVRDPTHVTIGMYAVSAPAQDGIRPLPVPPILQASNRLLCAQADSVAPGAPAYTGSPDAAPDVAELLPPTCTNVVSGDGTPWPVVAGAVYELHLGLEVAGTACSVWLGDNVAFDVAVSSEGGADPPPVRFLSSDVVELGAGVVMPSQWTSHPSGFAHHATPAPVTESHSSAELAAAQQACGTGPVASSNASVVRGTGRVLRFVACATGALRIRVDTRIVKAPPLPPSELPGHPLDAPVQAKERLEPGHGAVLGKAMEGVYRSAASAAGAAGDAVWTWEGGSRLDSLVGEVQVLAPVDIAHPALPMVLLRPGGVAPATTYTAFPSGGSGQFAFGVPSRGLLAGAVPAATALVQPSADSELVEDASTAMLVSEVADPFNAIVMPVVLALPAALSPLPSALEVRVGDRLSVAVGAVTRSGRGFTNCSTLANPLSWDIQTVQRGSQHSSSWGVTGAPAAPGGDVGQVLEPEVFSTAWQDYPEQESVPEPWTTYNAPPATADALWATVGGVPSAACGAVWVQGLAPGLTEVVATLDTLQSTVHVGVGMPLRLAHPWSPALPAEAPLLTTAPTPGHAGVYAEMESPAGMQVQPAALRWRWANTRTAHTLLLPVGAASCVVLEGGMTGQGGVGALPPTARTVRATHSVVQGALDGISVQWTSQEHNAGAAALSVFHLFVQCPQKEAGPVLLRLDVQATSAEAGVNVTDSVYTTLHCARPASVRPRLVRPDAQWHEWGAALFEPFASSHAADATFQGVPRAEQVAIQGVPFVFDPPAALGAAHNSQSRYAGADFDAATSSVLLLQPPAQADGSPRHQVYGVSVDLYSASQPPVRFASSFGWSVNISAGVGDIPLLPFPAPAAAPSTQSPAATCAALQRVYGLTPDYASSIKQHCPAEGLAELGSSALPTCGAGRVPPTAPAAMGRQLAEGGVLSGSTLAAVAVPDVSAGRLEPLRLALRATPLTPAAGTDALQHTATLGAAPRLDVTGADTAVADSSVGELSTHLWVFQHPRHLVTLPCHSGSGAAVWKWASASVPPADTSAQAVWPLTLSGSSSAVPQLASELLPTPRAERVWSRHAGYCRDPDAFAGAGQLDVRGVEQAGSATRLLAHSAGSLDATCRDIGLEASVVGRRPCMHVRRLQVTVAPAGGVSIFAQQMLHAAAETPLHLFALPVGRAPADGSREAAAAAAFPAWQEGAMRVTWSITNPSVLEVVSTPGVDGAGRPITTHTVRANRVGTATVVATIENCVVLPVARRGAPSDCPLPPAQDCSVVTSNALTFTVFPGLALMPKRVALLPSASLTLQGTAGPDAGDQAGMLWSSSNTTAVAVSANGTVTALAVGWATVTCTVLGTSPSGERIVLDSAAATVDVAVPTALVIHADSRRVLARQGTRLSLRSSRGMSALSLHGVGVNASWAPRAPGLRLVHPPFSGGLFTGADLSAASQWVLAGDVASPTLVPVEVNVTLLTTATPFTPALTLRFTATHTVHVVPRLRLVAPLPAAPLFGRTTGEEAAAPPTTVPCPASVCLLQLVSGSTVQFDFNLPLAELVFAVHSVEHAGMAVTSLTQSGWAALTWGQGESIVTVSHSTSRQHIRLHIIAARPAALALSGPGMVQSAADSHHRLVVLSAAGAPLALGTGVWTGLAGEPPTGPSSTTLATGSGPLPKSNTTTPGSVSAASAAAAAAAEYAHVSILPPGPLAETGVFSSRPGVIRATLRPDGTVSLESLSHGASLITVWTPRSQLVGGSRLYTEQADSAEAEVMFLAACHPDAMLGLSEAAVQAACAPPPAKATAPGALSAFAVVRSSTVLQPHDAVEIVQGSRLRVRIVDAATAAAPTQWATSDDAVATVSGGLVHAHTPGVAEVSVTADLGSRYVTSTLVVTVVPLTSAAASWSDVAAGAEVGGETPPLAVPLAPPTGGPLMLAWITVQVQAAGGLSVLPPNAALDSQLDQGVRFRCVLPPDTTPDLVALPVGPGALYTPQHQAIRNAAEDAVQAGMPAGQSGCAILLLGGAVSPRLHKAAPLLGPVPTLDAPRTLQVRVEAGHLGADGSVDFSRRGGAVRHKIARSVRVEPAVRPVDVSSGIALALPRGHLLLSSTMPTVTLAVYGDMQGAAASSSDDRVSVTLKPALSGQREGGEGPLPPSAYLTVSVNTTRAYGPFHVAGAVRLTQPGAHATLLHVAFEPEGSVSAFQGEAEEEGEGGEGGFPEQALWTGVVGLLVLLAVGLWSPLRRGALAADATATGGSPPTSPAATGVDGVGTGDSGTADPLQGDALLGGW